MTDAPYLKLTLDSAGQPMLTPDLEGAVVNRSEYDALLEECRLARVKADEHEGMAMCMREFRQSMIDAGIVGTSCPPMFMFEGVSSYIYSLAQQVGKSRM